MYYLVQIDVYQISQNQTTYRVTETKPKEVESSSKIEGTQYYHEQLVELAAKWAKEYATR